ncbi:MAG: CRISPR-associated endonuclease Cas2 [Chloroflexi bacterium]|nr:CRISPR-associated endonuclease Cas2 [Chloroflexota bacterium]
MQCLLIYDIPDDRTRQKIADACLDYGLQRVQYSAFVGNLSRSYQRELFIEVRHRLGKQPGNIQFFALDDASWRSRRVISQGETND